MGWKQCSKVSRGSFDSSSAGKDHLQSIAEAVALGETLKLVPGGEALSRALDTQCCLHEELLSACIERRTREGAGRVRMCWEEADTSGM